MLIRRLVLVVLFLVAQAGALAHGIGHAAEHEHEHEHEGLGHKAACELCMAYAPLGAGMASVPVIWTPPAVDAHFHAAPQVATSFFFRAQYLSRAPPI